MYGLAEMPFEIKGEVLEPRPRRSYYASIYEAAKELKGKWKEVCFTSPEEALKFRNAAHRSGFQVSLRGEIAYVRFRRKEE